VRGQRALPGCALGRSLQGASRRRRARPHLGLQHDARALQAAHRRCVLDLLLPLLLVRRPDRCIHLQRARLSGSQQLLRHGKVGDSEVGLAARFLRRGCNAGELAGLHLALLVQRCQHRLGLRLARHTSHSWLALTVQPACMHNSRSCLSQPHSLQLQLRHINTHTHTHKHTHTHSR
jgi:hypothetical protein